MFVCEIIEVPGQKKNRNLARFQNKKQMSIKLKQNSNIHLYSKNIYSFQLVFKNYKNGWLS